MNIEQKYIVKAKVLPGVIAKDDNISIKIRDTLMVHVFEKKEDGTEVKLGKYKRFSDKLGNTFYPFLYYGKDYAIFADKETSIKIVELSCFKEIASIESIDDFFISEFYIPYFPEKGVFGQFGFMAGFVWGKENLYRIRYLDLSKLKEGILTQDERFGQIELMNLPSMKNCPFSLKESIDLTDYSGLSEDGFEYPKIYIKGVVGFDLRTGNQWKNEYHR